MRPAEGTWFVPVAQMTVAMATVHLVLLLVLNLTFDTYTIINLVLYVAYAVSSVCCALYPVVYEVHLGGNRWLVPVFCVLGFVNAACSTVMSLSFFFSEDPWVCKHLHPCTEGLEDLVKEAPAVAMTEIVGTGELASASRPAPALGLARFPKGEPFTVHALYTYRTVAPNELAFRKRAVLTVTDARGRWWRAEGADGQGGFIPSNFVRVDRQARVCQPHLSPSVEEDEVALPVAGVLVEVLQVYEEQGRALIRNAEGQIGTVPVGNLGLYQDAPGVDGAELEV